MTVVELAVRGVSPALVLLPLLVVALYALVLGLALVVAVLHAYFRDVAPILSAVLLPWFFLSPIFFEPGDVTHQPVWADLLRWANPVAPFIEAIRDVTYGGTWPGGAVLLYVAAAAALALAGGRALFRHMEGELAVVV